MGRYIPKPPEKKVAKPYPGENERLQEEIEKVYGPILDEMDKNWKEAQRKAEQDAILERNLGAGVGGNRRPNRFTLG